MKGLMVWMEEDWMETGTKDALQFFKEDMLPKVKLQLVLFKKFSLVLSIEIHKCDC